MTARIPVTMVGGLPQQMQAGDALALPQQATPVAPPASTTEIYAKSDGNVYKQNPTGGEVQMPDLKMVCGLALALG